mmetsp:Transcript_17200/g.29728  ORF Transcript_17200/g.29728 Transcript_17200/m.29728 type:complete len:486 (-) Transcript_17200:408-1865(-)|eukprot:CAMPEP_0196665054 /NCGR_PEP_ID=MMETSP1086-20130531/59458_1 /TAXON_ID=77921 /ORGANISM="Cyanoptyche  gloeocystis , Strain SAG4.97" /LENGTH=485 /DNA_ID=CAMNT_0042001625 /DNA_START=37 /DNA_END=1494 /DNA_ORIENTATION=+
MSQIDRASENTLEDALVWATSHGLLMIPPSGKSYPGSYVHPPFSLTPSPVPRTLFKQAYELAEDFNLLVHRVSQDREFLYETLEPCRQGDEFTATLLDILKESESFESPQQPIVLGVHRSDYMAATGEGGPWLRQIEINTIAASFPMLSHATCALHRYVVSRYGAGCSLQDLPEHNASAAAIPHAIARAFALYEQQQRQQRAQHTPQCKLVVLMVVQEGERNVFDQRLLEHRLWDSHSVPVVRCSLPDIYAKADVHRLSHALLITDDVHGHVEAAVTYFRCGYTPRDYPSQKEWAARRMIERSVSIKCPNVAYHLAGTKKIQQVLVDPARLARYADDEGSARLLRCFAGLYSVSDPDADQAAMQRAIANPHTFVLKPQREGGGNNLYGHDVRTALQSMTATERGAFILMDRIVPPVRAHTPVVKEGALVWADTTWELGVYSVFLAHGPATHVNSAAGHLLRSKVATSNETGIAAGFGFLDSPCLT